MMKKKKTDFEAGFWSGSSHHSVLGLLEAFFQFSDLAIVKEALTAMMQCSVRKKSRIKEYPAEVFHLYLGLRSLVRACGVVAGNPEKWTVNFLPETHVPKPVMGALPEDEYRNPVRVFVKAFKAYSREEYDDFLSAMVYFSFSDSKCEEDKRIIGPYIHLIKMLDAAYLMVKRADKE